MGVRTSAHARRQRVRLHFVATPAREQGGGIMREGLILTSFLRQRGARRMEWNSVTIQRIRGPRNGVLHSGTLKRSKTT